MKFIVALILYISLFNGADAATCFWVGGTGTWDNSTDTAKWKSSSGGAGACAATGGVPKNAGDVATFDASSGGGTVTVNVNISIASIVMGAFTGTLDFSANNNNVTLTTAFNGTGSGVRTLNLGNGTWTLSGTGTVWALSTTTNLTFNANSSTIVFTSSPASARQMDFGGSLTYHTITYNASATAGFQTLLTGTGSTITTLNVTGPNVLSFSAGTTTTITNLNVTTTATTPFYFRSSSASGAATISSGSALTTAWTEVRDITFTGAGSLTANNSINGGGNTNVTINTPTSIGNSGTACILGGWLLWRDLPEHINDNFPAWIEKAS